MISYSRKSIKIAEVYFSAELPVSLSDVDLLRFIGLLLPRDDQDKLNGHTILIDLTQDSESLLKQMDSGTRYEIRRAETKDSLNFEFLTTCTREDVDIFCDYYDVFAQFKSLRRIFRPRLYELAKCNLLVLSSAHDIHGNILVRHSYITTDDRAMLLYSASYFRSSDDGAYRAFIGRANRALHWKEMLMFKQRRISCYDWSGVDISKVASETTRITQFKQGFGGQIVPVYSSTEPRSVKGLLINTLFRLFSIRF